MHASAVPTPSSGSSATSRTRWRHEAGIRGKQVTVAVVGSPGVFEASRGQVALAHNLPGWGREGLAEVVQQELGTKVAFENDVNLATLGERWRGLGKDVEDFVYLHVATGVGMGLVLNGELFRGSTGAAGEVGYLPLGDVDPHGAKARRRGALEGALGAEGVVALARTAGMRAPLTPRRIFDAARDGDARALGVVQGVAERIALAIAAIVPVVDPELVILGGGVGRNGDLLLEPDQGGTRGALAVPAARRGVGARRGRRVGGGGLDGARCRPGAAVRTY